MSKILQPGQHPDADQLNAFVEHSLPLHERQETLAHLATCADCRAIVYLVQPAILEGSAQPRPIATRKPWFSGWNLVWPAAAGLACLVILTVHLHNLSAGKREAVPIATAHLQETPPQLPTAPPPAQALPPTPGTSRIPKPQPIVVPITGDLGAVAKSDRDRIEGGRQQQGRPAQLESRSIAALTPPQAELGTTSTSTSGQQSISSAKSDASFQSANPAPATSPMAGLFNTNPSPQAATGASDAVHLQPRDAGAGAVSPGNPSRTPALHSLSQQYNRALPVAPPPSSAQPLAAPTASSQTAAVTDAVSIEPGSNAPSPVIAGAAIGPLENKSAKLQSMPILPSHLPAISTISNARQELAIDAVGTLFRSEDGGVTWRQVPAQWAGRAVGVGLAQSTNQEMADKDASLESATQAAAKRSTVAPAQSLAFELTTDAHELWISTDGRTWKRK